MEQERGGSTSRGHEEEMKMELELDAAHALANLAGSGPVSNQSSISQEGDPHQFQEKVVENSNEEQRNQIRHQILDQKMGPRNSGNQAEVSSSRGHKSLSEAERDAKRLRRILANRESARQTILRRQAFRDELARQVSILSAENLVLKREKENATREYIHQKEMNQELKEQMMQISPFKEEKMYQLALSTPAPEGPMALSRPECVTTSGALTITSKTAPEDVSCSLTLSIGETKDETSEQKHEAAISKKKLNSLQIDTELDEACSPYLLLDAAGARKRRIEIARSRHFIRN